MSTSGREPTFANNTVNGETLVSGNQSDGDGQAGFAANGLRAVVHNAVFNGATWDRQLALGAAGDGLGVALAMPPSALPATVTSGANAAASITLGAVAGQRNRLVDVSFAASGGAVTAATATLTDGGVTKQSWVVSAVGTMPVQLADGGLKCGVNAAMVVTVPALGAGVLGIVNVGTLTG